MSRTREIGIFGFTMDDDFQLGGRPRLPPDIEWPFDPETQKPFAFLFGLRGEVLALAANGLDIPPECELSVFASVGPDGFDHRLAVGDRNDGSLVPSVPSTVLLHRRTSDSRDLPADFSFPIRPARVGLGPEVEEEVLGTGELVRSASGMPKVGGVPSWLQDPVPVEDSVFILQLSSRIIEMLGPPQFSDVLGGGIGYLFLHRKPQLGRAGHFFVQFT